MLVCLCASVPELSILICCQICPLRPSWWDSGGFVQENSVPSSFILTVGLTLSVRTGNCMKPSKHFSTMNQLTSSSENTMSLEILTKQCSSCWWTVGGWSVICKNVGTYSLPFEELTTVLAEAQSILNSWPLTPPNSLPTDGTPLYS